MTNSFAEQFLELRPTNLLASLYTVELMNLELFRTFSQLLGVTRKTQKLTPPPSAQKKKKNISTRSNKQKKIRI